MRAVAITVGRADFRAAVRLFKTVIPTGSIEAEQVSLRLSIEYRPDMPLRYTVEAHQDLVGLQLLKNRPGHLAEGFNKGGVVVIRRHHLEGGLLPELAGLFEELLNT